MSIQRRLRRKAAAVAALGGAVAAIAATATAPRAQQLRYRRPVYRYRRRPFRLRRWSDEKIQLLCRFTRSELRRLLPLLHLDEIRWTGGVRPKPETALCLLLVRLSYPGRLLVIADHFGRSPAWCSTVFNDVAIHIFTKFRGILEWHPLLNYQRMARFAEAISDLLESRDGQEPPGFVAGEESALFWGFVDGTFRGFCRPTAYEQ